MSRTLLRFILIASSAWAVAFCAGARGENVTAHFYSIPFTENGTAREHTFVRLEKSVPGQSKQVVDISWLPAPNASLTAPVKGKNFTLEETVKLAQSAQLKIVDKGVFKATEDFFLRAKARAAALTAGAFTFRRPALAPTATQIDAAQAIRGISKDTTTRGTGLTDSLRRAGDLILVGGQQPPQPGPEGQPFAQPKIPQPLPKAPVPPPPQPKMPDPLPQAPQAQPKAPAQPFLAPAPRLVPPGTHGVAPVMPGVRPAYVPRALPVAPCRSFCRRWCAPRYPCRRRC